MRSAVPAAPGGGRPRGGEGRAADRIDDEAAASKFDSKALRAPSAGARPSRRGVAWASCTELAALPWEVEVLLFCVRGVVVVSLKDTFNSSTTGRGLLPG